MAALKTGGRTLKTAERRAAERPFTFYLLSTFLPTILLSLCLYVLSWHYCLTSLRILPMSDALTHLARYQNMAFGVRLVGTALLCGMGQVFCIRWRTWRGNARACWSRYYYYYHFRHVTLPSEDLPEFTPCHSPSPFPPPFLPYSLLFGGWFC